MIIYRLQVIQQASRDPSLAIFMLLEPYSVSSPLCIESKGIKTVGKPNPVLFDEKSFTDKSQWKNNSSD